MSEAQAAVRSSAQTRSQFSKLYGVWYALTHRLEICLDLSTTAQTRKEKGPCQSTNKIYKQFCAGYIFYFTNTYISIASAYLPT